MKGIFFDIGYTLCRMNTGDWRATDKFYEYIPREYMAGLPGEVIRSAYDEGNRVQAEWNFVMNTDEEYRMNIESYQAMIACFPEISVSEEAIREIAWDRTYNMDNYYFYKGVRELFEKLSKDYKIGIISDTWPSADEVLKKAGVYDYIDSFTYSCYLGTSKPDEKMYLHALEHIGLPAEETVFIDDYPKNLEAAEKLGITPVLILTKEKKGARRFAEISDLRELTELPLFTV